MYCSKALARLAEDDAFRHDVHGLARQLLVHPAVIRPERIAALTRYGADQPAVALRLLHVDQWVDMTALDDAVVHAWLALLVRVRAAAG
jgi:hypothetical protein